MSSPFRSVRGSSGRETSLLSTGHPPLAPAASAYPPATPRPSVHRPALILVVAVSLLASSGMGAQACSSSHTFLASLPVWSPPLDRRVSLHVRDISLREALDRISAEARIRLSYTTEAIPLDNRICASMDSIYV